MRLREVERIARRVVPGNSAPRLYRVGVGLLHETFRVDRDGRPFSMRLASASRNAEQATAWLARVLEEAAAHALAAPLVHRDAKRGIIVQQWLEGRAWPASPARRAQNIERMAQLLRRVHAMAVPAPARVSSPRAWVRHYTAALAALERPAEAALAGAAAARLARLEALPRIEGVVCHSDLHRLNLLECGPRRGQRSALLLLDWEYAHVAEPGWDLAGWSANNDFSPGLLRQLLIAYLGRAPDEGEWARCNLLLWLYDYVCLLWGQLYLNSRRATVQIEARALVLQARLSRD